MIFPLFALETTGFAGWCAYHEFLLTLTGLSHNSISCLETDSEILAVELALIYGGTCLWPQEWSLGRLEPPRVYSFSKLTTRPHHLISWCCLLIPPPPAHLPNPSQHLPIPFQGNQKQIFSKYPLRPQIVSSNPDPIFGSRCWLIRSRKINTKVVRIHTKVYPQNICSLHYLYNGNERW